MSKKTVKKVSENENFIDKNSRVYKAERIITLIFRIFMIAGIAGEIYFQAWLNVFVAGLTLFVSFVPNIIHRKAKLYFPPEIQIAIVVFLFAAMFLGELQNYYYRFWWWDTLLHLLAGIIFGLVGFFLMYAMNSDQRFKVTMSPFFVALFAFCFSLMIGVMWEIFEFFMDQTFGMNMQKGNIELNMKMGLTHLTSGVQDTMWDFIADSIGAFIAAVIGYNYMKKKKDSLLIRIVLKTFDSNKDLFHKKKNKEGGK